MDFWLSWNGLSWNPWQVPNWRDEHRKVGLKEVFQQQPRDMPILRSQGEFQRVLAGEAAAGRRVFLWSMRPEQKAAAIAVNRRQAGSGTEERFV